MRATSHRRIPGTAIAAVAALSLAAAGCGGGGDGGDPQRNADADSFTLTIASNAVEGGKNAEGAEWITDWVIPQFTEAMEAAGIDATIEFQGSGVDDEDYKTKQALDIRTGAGADLIAIDGIWVGEFAQAGYIQPLDQVIGTGAQQWGGWEQIPQAVQENMSFEGDRYGIPTGTDGRVVYFNKELFAQAGLPTDWQPTSWAAILEAARTIEQELSDVVPIQLNAGTAMGEATTMQGFLPMLAGTGHLVYEDGTWHGDSQAVRDVLDFYQTIYADGLGDPRLQQEAQGRDNSFIKFADGEIAILFEGDYFWRSVVSPDAEIAPMDDRDEVVGYAKIPAREPGAGVRGQNFVSMSGGGGYVINPNTDYPQQAWELLTFMNSAEAYTEQVERGVVGISPREDVNAQELTDPMLGFVADEVLPITAYRPGFAVYPQVSVAIQEATADVVAGQAPAEVSATYGSSVAEATGGAESVLSD